ncbi:hypothetical protein BDV93DRAFT_306959 [Ceratobasidium sp. AG-I]|nr:hypothetical protein BDV93DRAFT_306959 [Ceratobasidium sp. AG-I]
MNLVCIYMIGARRKFGETNPYWLVRLRYDHSSGIPYLVPNAVMVFLLFNGIFALLMQPYIWINYVSYLHRTRAFVTHSGLFFWYGFIFVFDGSGMWISAFGTFYATLLPQLLVSNKVSNSRFFVHPVFLNILCYGLPVALFITQVVTSALSQVAWRRMALLQLDIVDKLHILNQQWLASNKTAVDKAALNDAFKMDEALVSAVLGSRAAFVRNALTCGVWYLLCFLFFTPSAIWLLYVLRRIVTHRLQFVTRMPTSEVDIQFQVPMDEAPGSSSRLESGDSQEAQLSIHQLPEPRRPPPSFLSLGDSSGRGMGSEETTPTSAVFLASGRTDIPLSPASTGGAERDRASLHGRTRSLGYLGSENEGGHSQRPHDPGGPLQLDITPSSSKTTRKLQTAYYSAMLQFIATGLCLAIATASWIWAAADTRVVYDATLHAVAVLMTVWVYSVVGIIVNVFICIRLRAIGFNLPKSKIVSYLYEMWSSNTSRDRQS